MLKILAHICYSKIVAGKIVKVLVTELQVNNSLKTNSNVW